MSMQSEQFYSSLTWETRAWVDGQSDVDIKQWCNIDEAMAMAEAGMKHKNSDSIVRLEIVGTRFLDDSSGREETVWHRWKQDHRFGGFRQTIYDGTEIL